MARNFDSARILNNAQKRELIRAQLKETPELSNRTIANWLSVSPATVAVQRGKLEESGQIERFSTRIDPRTGNQSQPVERTRIQSRYKSENE